MLKNNLKYVIYFFNENGVLNQDDKNLLRMLNFKLEQ